MLVVALAGCAPAGATGIELSSARRGDDVSLTWQGNRGDVVVEFATAPGGPYTILDFVRGGPYVHPDLMPATTFYYRVRPVEGPASAPATAVPAAPVQGEDWLVPGTAPDGRAKPAPGGAPANLLVESVGPDAVRLTWTDNATGEDGYLVEQAVDGGYRVAFVVDPDVNHVGLTGGVGVTYRVRAYHYGPASNVVHEEIPG